MWSLTRPVVAATSWRGLRLPQLELLSEDRDPDPRLPGNHGNQAPRGVPSTWGPDFLLRSDAAPDPDFCFLYLAFLAEGFRRRPLVEGQRSSVAGLLWMERTSPCPGAVGASWWWFGGVPETTWPGCFVDANRNISICGR